MDVTIKIPLVCKNGVNLKNKIFKDGVFFYSAEPNAYFTLPVGNYRTEYPISPVKAHVRKVILPKPETSRPLGSDVPVIRVKNPHKATVFFDKRKILMDEKLYDCCAEVIQKAVLYHEHGHQFYKTESKCDFFAQELLLKEGYNPAQIMAGFKASGLSDSGRLSCIEKTLKRVKSF